MKQLFVFTAGKTEAREHLNNSILQPVAPETIFANFNTHDHDSLHQILGEAGGFYCWGATPGKRNIPNWEKLEPGDHVVAVYGSHYRHYFRLLKKFHNAACAEAIWGRDENGETWEYMYFLTPPMNIEVPLHNLDAYLYRRYQGFTRISDDRIESIVTAYGSLDAFVSSEYLAEIPTQSQSLWTQAESILVTQGGFDPTDDTDARQRTITSIVQRRGQPAFRISLMRAYQSSCAVTGCKVEEVLEAAHIRPYRGEQTNRVPNGMLLRSDVHTLFDSGMVGVDPTTMKLVIADELRGTEYGPLDGRDIYVPTNPAERPDLDALLMHLEESGLIGVP